MKHYSIFLAMLWCANLFSQPSSDYKLVFQEDFSSILTFKRNWNMSDCYKASTNISVTKSNNYVLDTTSTITALGLIANKEEYTCDGITYDYTSSLANSVHYLYGYFEINAWVPGGCGAWPAFWFWSGGNDTQYSEIDVLESCGLECDEYQVGYFYDSNNDGLAESTNNPNADISVNSICSGYNRYGFEWTPTTLKWYFNGNLVETMNNLHTHQTLHMLLGLGLGNFSGCLDNCNIENSGFPRYFNVDWVKVYKKENTALFFKVEDTQICVGQETNIYVPIYGTTIDYNWSFTPANSFQIIEEVDWVGIQASDMPGFQGSWHKLRVKGLTAGNNTITLTYNFPSGYSETQSINIKVISGPPSPQTSIGYFALEHPACCYGFRTNLNQDATSYVWTITKYGGFVSPQTFTTSTNQLVIPCFFHGDYLVKVVARNLCGNSNSYQSFVELPRLECGQSLTEIFVTPNPAENRITIELIDVYGNNNFTNAGGSVLIVNMNGENILNSKFDSNPKTIDLSDFDNGYYQVVYKNSTTILNKPLIISRSH